MQFGRPMHGDLFDPRSRLQLARGRRQRVRGNQRRQYLYRPYGITHERRGGLRFQHSKERPNIGSRFLDLPNEYACIGCPADRGYVVLSVDAGGENEDGRRLRRGKSVELWGIQQAIDSLFKSIQWTPK